MHCTNKQTAEPNRQRTLQQVINFMTDALIKAGKPETSRHWRATSHDSIHARSLWHLFSLKHSDFMDKNCSLQHNPLYTYLKTSFSGMNTTKNRAQLVPMLKDHRAVFVLQILKFIPASTFYGQYNINFRSKLSFFNESEQSMNKQKMNKWKNLLYLCALNLFCSEFVQLFYYNYTGCNRKIEPDFERVFLRSRYTDITQNTYTQS